MKVENYRTKEKFECVLRLEISTRLAQFLLKKKKKPRLALSMISHYLSYRHQLME